MSKILYLLNEKPFLYKTYNNMGYYFFIKLDEKSKIKLDEDEIINLQESNKKICLCDENILQNDYFDINFDIVHENIKIKNDVNHLTLIEKDHTNLLIKYNCYYDIDDICDHSLPYVLFSEYQFINYKKDINKILEKNFLTSRNLNYQKYSNNVINNLELITNYKNKYEEVINYLDEKIIESKKRFKKENDRIHINKDIDKLLGLYQLLNEDNELYLESFKKINNTISIINNIN